MKLYLDNSFLNRPFDNPNVEINNSLNPFPERKIFIEEALKLAKKYQNLNVKIQKEAANLVREQGLKPIDALHLATAAFAEVDFFITGDYNVIKRYRGALRVIRPVEFLNYYENHNR